MDVDAILFDFDDTLYRYAPCNEAGLDAAYRAVKKSIRIEWKAFQALHDAVRGEFAQRLAGQAGSHNRVLFFKEIAFRLFERDEPGPALEMHEAYWTSFHAAMEPAPSAHEVLATLKRHYKLALISNHVTHVQLDKVLTLGMERYFPIIVTSEEVGLEKPARAIFRHTLDRLDSRPDRTLMVGDSDSGDITGAARAGLHTVRTTEFVPSNPDPTPADHHIHSLAALPAILD